MAKKAKKKRTIKSKKPSVKRKKTSPQKKKSTKKSSIRKTVKKRKSNKGAAKKRTKATEFSGPAIIQPERWHLHCAKLLIKKAVPMMPCTSIKRDRNGRLFAHTQAEKVYEAFREQCQIHRLVIRRERGNSFSTTRPSLRFTRDDIWETLDVPCVRFEGQWEICHVDSGEYECFGGTGDGDNEIWSVNSAQTVAKKCGLLDYFEVPWPQPDDWVQAIKNTVEVLPPEEMKEALIEIIPSVIMESTSIGDEIMKYFDSVMSRKKG